MGVVGRTGAGKSSLLLVLLRLVEPEAGGKLVVDGHDVLKMGLDDLRRNISIIPQVNAAPCCAKKLLPSFR